MEDEAEPDEDTVLGSKLAELKALLDEHFKDKEDD